MQIDELPALAFSRIISHCRKIDWYSIRKVSRAWKEAVESQITHLRNQDTTVLLNDASSLPRDLPARFPRLGTLDLGENRDYSARENEVNQAILSMPNLRELLGYACIKGLRQLDSPQHLEQRANLAARLTSLSAAPDCILRGRDCVSIAAIAEEFGALKSFRLCPDLSCHNLDEFGPLLENLERLEVSSSKRGPLDALIALDEAVSLKTLLIRMGEYATVEEAGLADSETFYQLLANLHELERLECVGIVLGDHGLEALNSLTKLTGLSLQRSYVSSNGLSALTALSGIESLNVQHCMLSTRRPRRELTGIDAWAVGLPQAFASFRQLRHLDVSDCEELRADEALGQLTTLTSLYAANCPKFGSLAPLQPLTRLQRLQLASAGGCTTGALEAFQRLSSLDLSRSCVWRRQASQSGSLTDEDIRAVGKLTGLCHLNLAGNTLLTRAGFRHLSSLHALAFLNLQNCSDTLELRRALPSHPSVPVSEVEASGCDFPGLVHVWAESRRRSVPNMDWPNPDQAQGLLLPPYGRA